MLKNNQVKSFWKSVPSAKAELILLFVSLLWGLSFPFIKISLNYTSPIFLVFIRSLLTLIFFFIFYNRENHFRDLKFSKGGAILGLLLFTGFISQTIGMKFTSASNSAFITGSNIILIPFVQYMLLRTKPGIENLIGMAIVFTGMYLLTGLHKAPLNTGDLITLFSALAYSFYPVLLDKYSKENSVSLIFAWQFMVMMILSFISFIVFEIIIFNDYFFIPDINLVAATVFNSIFPTLIAFILIAKYQKQTTPLKAGLIYNMELVFAVVFSFMILGEVLDRDQITGGLIMFSGLCFSEFYRFFKSKQAI